MKCPATFPFRIVSYRIGSIESSGRTIDEVYTEGFPFRIGSIESEVEIYHDA